MFEILFESPYDFIIHFFKFLMNNYVHFLKLIIEQISIVCISIVKLKLGNIMPN
jgi:L-cystine uptake protein TcyP (sodium:dicarboxylate symporter family)